MKLAKICVAGICLIALAGCGREPEPEQETPEQKIGRWHHEANESMRQEATNQVPGIHQIIFADVENWDQPAVAWRGHVTLDYVNHIGGIDRTNLYFKFVFSSHASALTDCERAYQMDIYAITNH